LRRKSVETTIAFLNSDAPLSDKVKIACQHSAREVNDRQTIDKGTPDRIVIVYGTRGKQEEQLGTRDIRSIALEPKIEEAKLGTNVELAPSEPSVVEQGTKDTPTPPIGDGNI
jgi:hypothetical protein